MFVDPCFNSCLVIGLSCTRDCVECRSPHGAEQDEHAGGHGVLVCKLQGNRIGGIIPRKGMGLVFTGGVRVHIHGRHHHPQRLV